MKINPTVVSVLLAIVVLLFAFLLLSKIGSPYREGNKGKPKPATGNTGANVTGKPISQSEIDERNKKEKEKKEKKEKEKKEKERKTK